ncbi:helix-hairpin-helix domain-containing protein [Micromonospora sp. CB01531]|uniref:helix-hairpin-helix domain-containing protein n=1 Tax=Micromonospora sp. CB01531 TaxID=1718947 RepID=UPI00093B1D07|nr:helix-hairpin-helix domain-containing protein [Micromonospora sp. CB01531]OKI62459.1 hypothetical protein A6A27_05705 [Micromonospora sp. CB01531]
MSSSFGLWLVVILAVVAGLVIWRVLAGGRTTAGPAAPTVEGDPTTATSDQERPAAVVDEVPAPAAVTEEPAPAEQDAPPVANPAVEATAPLSAESAGSAPADQPAEAAPVTVKVEPAAVDPEPATTEAEPVTPAATPAEPATPVTIPAPRASVENTTTAVAEPAAAPAEQAADDFRQIQGIGPKMAAALQAAGIRTYQQLAELDEAALRETIKAAGLRAAPSVATWPQQAKVLAGARAEAEAVLP